MADEINMEGAERIFKEISEKLYELFQAADQDKLDDALKSGDLALIAETIGISEKDLSELRLRGEQAQKILKVTIPDDAREGDPCPVSDGGVLVLSDH